VKVILNEYKFEVVIERLAHQIIENYPDIHQAAFIGLQPRGIALSDTICNLLQKHLGVQQLNYGVLDITMYRDDVAGSAELKVPYTTDIPFDIDGKNVLLIDDVLYTGRTIRSAFDALIDFGRPNKVELMVFVDRRFSREFPIEPNYVGVTVDSTMNQKVKVNWQQQHKVNQVILLDN
jgi:pyrimidine operon attenuation protein / uracil phosphoribosyltransferase